MLVYQLINVMLQHCLINEPKGWQVVDQALWCLNQNQPNDTQTLAKTNKTTPTADILGLESNNNSSNNVVSSVHPYWLLNSAISLACSTQ